MDLPLMQLNRKLLKDEDDIFGKSEHGLNVDDSQLLNNFKFDDLEEFM